MFAGLGGLFGCGAGAVVLAIQDQVEIAPYVAGAGGLAYFVSTIAAMIPQQVTLEVTGKRVVPSWRAAIEVDRIEIGSWVLAGVDVATGIVVTLRGAGRTLRIGGDKHGGEGYTLGDPTRTVDCQLPREAFDDLVKGLGIITHAEGPLAVPLVRSSQSFGGGSSDAPWLITISLLGVLGLVVGNTSWGEVLLASPEGQLGMAVVSGGLAVTGICWMFVRSRRVRVAELELGEESDALVIRDQGGAVQRVPWKAIEIEKRTYSVTSRVGTFAMPVLVLSLPERKPLRLGAWDTQLAWPGQPAKTWRAPTWIVGTAKWPKLLDALERHGRL